MHFGIAAAILLVLVGYLIGRGERAAPVDDGARELREWQRAERKAQSAERKARRAAQRVLGPGDMYFWPGVVLRRKRRDGSGTASGPLQ
jgi:hypothetical protein